MDSLDLSPNVLWHTLSKDVYTLGKREPQESIMETNESLTESRPLLQSPQAKEQKKKAKGAGWMATSFLLVNTALGIGILNFPAAFDQAGGILCATVIQLIMVCLMLSTMLILAYCSDLNGDETYYDVLLSMCGKKAQQLAAVSITFTLYFVCVATLIIIGDQMDSLLSSIIGMSFCQQWYLRRTFTISLISIVFVLPACFCKRVDFLSCIGSLGIFAMLYPVFLTVYGYFRLTPKDVVIKTRPDSFSQMFAMFPVLGFGYQVQEVVVPVYSCMRERNLSQFLKSSVCSMAFLMMIYFVIGCFGYLTFGAGVASNIMKMYNADDPFVMIGVGALIIKMAVTYPILALCGRDAVGGIYAELRGLKPLDFQRTERKRRYVVAFFWFFSSLLLSVLTKNIGVVIKYLGSVASINIFFFPGICLLQMAMTQDPDMTKRRSHYMVAYGIIVAGIGAFCSGVVLLEAILDQSSVIKPNLCDGILKEIANRTM